MPENSKEPTDEELLAELEKEAHDAQTQSILNDTDVNIDDMMINNNKTENVHNESILKENEDKMNINIEAESSSSSTDDYSGGAQITTFQDNIITTGSDVSVLLMIILFILFIIQAIRKAFNYFTLQSALKQVSNPLTNAKP
eukprot:554538_1